MPGQRWTFLSAVPVWPALLARVCARWRSPACVRVGLRPCVRSPVCGAALAHVVRAYMVDSPVVLLLAGARCSVRCASRKLFRDRFQAVDICSAVVRRDG